MTSEERYAELVEDYGWDPVGARRFMAWSRALNNILIMECGVGIEDGPDFDQAGMFEDGLSPRQAAEQVLDERGYFDRPFSAALIIVLLLLIPITGCVKGTPVEPDCPTITVNDTTPPPVLTKDGFWAACPPGNKVRTGITR